MAQPTGRRSSSPNAASVTQQAYARPGTNSVLRFAQRKSAYASLLPLLLLIRFETDTNHVNVITFLALEALAPLRRTSNSLCSLTS
jgi:hypothetical protein